MNRVAYGEQDYIFGQTMLTLRSATGLTQEGLAGYLGVSRRAVGAWEAGSKYPKADHLKHFIALAVEHQAFSAGRAGEEIRALWHAARQKVLLDEVWLAALLTPVAERASVRVVAPTALPTIAEAQAEPARATNLPFQPTTFIGRSAELDALAGLLGDPKCRLLTLLGPGGVGKTRLALEAAAVQGGLFAGGVAFVPLAPVGSSNQIVAAICDALCLRLAGQTNLLAHLLDFLRGRHMLLVLDNFEHLLDGADLIQEINQHAPQVTLLVTSRERLNLRAEWLFDVEGLLYPPDTVASRGVDLGAYSAVQLFVQRATQVQPGLALAPATLDTIVSICRHVAGMPLAIELAAASVRLLSIAEIERQLRSSIDILATTLRDMPARHRSMRAVFDQSWQLLSERERALFSRLGVFRGGCTSNAANKVAGATLTALTALVDKSLLRQVGGPQSGPHPRFFLLEPIREYALAQLAERDEADALQQRHAAYYLAQAEAMAAQWDGPNADPAIEQFERDYDNLRAALQWAGDGGDITLGLQLGVALRKYWQRRGHYSEGRAWLEGLLALDNPDRDAAALAARFRALHTAAWLASDQHDYARATQLYDQSMALRDTLGETAGGANLLAPAARQARATGQYRQATALLEDVLARHRAAGDRGSLSSGGMGLALYELALALREQGDFARATALFAEDLQLHRELGDREGITVGLLGLGDLARDQADAAGTRLYCEQSLSIAGDLGLQWARGFALNNLALAAYLDRDIAQAAALIGESTALFRSLQAESSMGEVLITQAHIQRAQGDSSAAYAAISTALRLARELGPRVLVPIALEGLAGLVAGWGFTDLALQLLGAAAALRSEMGTPMRPLDQVFTRNIEANARATLGAERSAAQLAAGQTRALDDLINAVNTIAPLDTPSLAPESPAQQVGEQIAPIAPPPGPRFDWGDARNVPAFYGREWELALLNEWVIDEGCRVVSVQGLGGIGKSALAVSLMHRVAERYDVVIWRSLLDAPAINVLLDDFLQVIAPQALGAAPGNLERRLSLLLEHLRRSRVLLVLDNLETLLEMGEGTGHMRAGFEGYGVLLRRMAETEHQSCLLFTSREKPSDLVSLEGSHSPVRVLRLARLNAAACAQLLAEKDIHGTPAELAQLIEAYAGNPLALKIVAQSIVDLFDGAITPFLQQGEVIFGGVREMLGEQFARLSPLEQCLLLWLAIRREPSTLDELAAVLVTPLPRGRLLEAIEALRRRSLIERGPQQGSFVLQSVVLEYATAQLIADASREIEQGRLARLIEHGITLARARENSRLTQERLIVTPLLHQLQSSMPQHAALEGQLLRLLDQLSTRAEHAQGYGPANMLALLRRQRGDLRGIDLARLALRDVYFQGVEMQDASLAGALIQHSVFTETFDALTAVAISGDGEYWAAASRRGEVRLWTAGGQTLQRVWQAHSDLIWPLAFSPDGRTLASGSWDGMIKLWDVAGGGLLWSGQHAGLVNGIAFAPDGSMLASSGGHETMLWDSKRGSVVRTLQQPDMVIAVAWSPDDRLIATGDMEGGIRLWDVSATDVDPTVQLLRGHQKLVGSVAFAPDGGLLASASWDGTVKLWEVASGQVQRTLAGHTDRVHRVAWSPDGRIVASSSRDADPTIWLWDIESGAYRAALQGHRAGVDGLAFTPDSHSLLSGSQDGTLRLWDVGNGECLRVIQGYAVSLFAVDWSPDGTQLVSGGSDTLLKVWDAAGETRPRLLHGHSAIVFGAAWSPDGRYLVSGGWDNALVLWDAQAGAQIEVVRDEGTIFNGVAWSPDGQQLAGGTYRRGVLLWNVAAGQRRWLQRDVPTWIRPVAWSPDGTRLAGGGDDGAVYIWDVAAATLSRRLAGHHSMVSSVAWSPDGTQIASGGSGAAGGELFIWDAESGARLATLAGHGGMVSALCWGPGDDLLLSGDSEGNLCWWDMSTQSYHTRRQAHQGTIRSLRRSPDGSRLAAGGDDGAITIWDLHSGAFIRTLRRDRPYERLNITGIRGLSEVQKTMLRTLGAIDNAAQSNNYAH